PAPRPLAPALDARVAPLAEALRTRHRLGAVSIAVVDARGPVWGWAGGRARRDVAASAGTVYRVGSVSKLFTDLAVMRLVERGRLDLDAPVTRYLPSFTPRNPWRTPITLRMLMAHRAGLVREPPVGHYFDATAPTLEATVASLNATSLVYQPGSRTKYSNAGIAVVGRVLEVVTGRPFAEYLAADVLAPLGMTRSAFVPAPDVVDALADGWMGAFDRNDWRAPTFELGMAPAGSLYSTVTDIGRFATALLRGGEGERGRLVTRATLERMWQPAFPGAQERAFGIGFVLGDLAGRRRIGHGGAIYGFATELAVLPEDGLGVVVAIATDGANAIAGRLADEALLTALAARTGRQRVGPPEPVPVPDSLAARLAGRWSGGTLLRRHGTLAWEPPGASLTPLLLGLRGDSLVIDDRLAQRTTFALTRDGPSAGGETWTRLPDSLPPEAPAALAPLLGEYGWDHNILYLLEDGGQLRALVEWFFPATLTAVDDSTWRFPASGLYAGETLVILRDAARRVTGVSLGGVVFPRRAIGPADGGQLRITPLRPVEELRAEADRATPPADTASRAPDLVDLAFVDRTFRFDVRYATTNNFLGVPLYASARAFLQRPAADALRRANRSLAREGYGLLIHDGYRPWAVTKLFWEATPPAQRWLVADPAQGSRHNRGMAVDLTLYELESGRPVTMPGTYDEASDRSFPDYPGGTARQRWLRARLRGAMEAAGFTIFAQEWWHFDFAGWRAWPVLNVPFERLDAP
ncbi:MAG: serine hydrolase, partial [Gemmatimonadales bacterium]|nr:serine hydrolase [Gemmatimonadales bacterium]